MSREGGRARKEILEANQQASVATPPGMESQGPWVGQRRCCAEKPAPGLPSRLSPQPHHPGLGQACGQALGPVGMGREVTDEGTLLPAAAGSHQPEEAKLT